MDVATTEESSESNYSDDFIASDDDNEDGLTWDSEDSRPPAPSPPSSTMNDSPVINTRTRVRRTTRRRVYVEPETQSDDEVTDYVESTASLSSNIRDFFTLPERLYDSDETNYTPRSPSQSPPPSPSGVNFYQAIHQRYSPMQSPNHPPDVNFDQAVQQRYSPMQNPNHPPDVNFDQAVHQRYSPMQRQNHPPDEEFVSRSNSLHIEATPHSPNYPPPEGFVSRSNSPTIETVPHSPDYPPPEEFASRSNSPTRQAIPLSPRYPPPDSTEANQDNQDSEPDVQIIDPPEQEAVAELQVPHESSQPSRDEPLESGAQNPMPRLKESTEPSANFNSSTLSESDEGTLCSICMDPLTNSGKHRVVCLRCGHIFGQSCVERWIKVGCNNGAKRCPTCNKKACLKDIRVLYLPKVIPLDTVEKDRLVQENDQVLAQKRFIEMELASCKLRHELAKNKYEEKIQQLEKELFEAANTIELLSQGKKISPPEFNLTRDAVRAELRHMVEITKDGGCRVLAFNHILQELVVSQPSGNTVFAGYGVRILDSVNFTPTRFVYLHQKMIRDLAFHLEDRDMLLSVSLDQTAKLVDLASCTTVHTFRGEGPLWSCCWDVSNPHMMLVGSQVGKVFQYDRRMLHHYVTLWESKNNLTPVVALASVPSVESTPFPQGGFLSCRLNCVFAYARRGETYNSQEILSDGPYMSMRYDQAAQSLLTVSRPSSRCNYARINMDLLDVDEKGKIFLPEIHKFNCGSSARVMSRLTTFPTVNDVLVVAHHESGRSVKMWSSKTGDCVYSIPVKEPVIDLTSMIYPNNKCLLATLSEKKVGIYNVV